MSGPALLCYDGSPHAADAIAAAGRLLRPGPALVLTVAVPAAEELPIEPLSELVGRVSGLYREWDEIAAAVAERQAQEGSQLAARAGFASEALVAHGRPAATILRVAQARDAGVIVLGRGHHGGLGALGSVATRVMHHAHRPVLVLPQRQGPPA